MDIILKLAGVNNYNALIILNQTFLVLYINIQ